jgi:hypothetical protein
MKAGKYTLHELFSNPAIEQLIVPEIQRDYVWDDKQLLPFLASLRAEAQGWKQSAVTPALPELDVELKAAFERFYQQEQQQKHSHSIGFIYAYQDSAYPGRYFLIDGQQRLTTLYLLLLALAAKGPAATTSLTHFRDHYCSGQQPRLDYRVRESAHVFLQQLVASVLTNAQPFTQKGIEQQYWYFSAYKDDVTVQNLLKNYALLVQQLAAPDCPLTYEFVRNFVQFWYFNAGSSAQGEELYISMNSTGQPVEANENVKALMLDRLPVNAKAAAGQTWEEWQDFFWRYRAGGQSGTANADRGFNEFLQWAHILKPILRQEAGLTKASLREALQKREKTDNQDFTGLTFENIAALMTAVQQVFQALPAHYPSLAAAYPPDALLPISTLIPSAWLAGNAARSQKSLQQLDYFRLLPVLTYCLVVAQQQRPLNWPMLYRMVRYFFNLHRTSTVSKNPADACADGIILAQRLAAQSDDIATGLDQLHVLLLISQEERRKFALYRNPPAGVERTGLEAILWQLEDHAFNGGEVEHLLPETDSEQFRATLERIHTTFFRLFPTGQTSLPLLQKVLLYYGAYWQRESPWYYSIYNFEDWSATVRGKQFREFFADFSTQPLTLEAFYLAQKAVYFQETTVQQLRQTEDERGQLIVLSALYDLAQARYGQPLSMWKVGSYIGFHYGAASQHPVFVVDREYINAHRYLGGNSLLTLTQNLHEVCTSNNETINLLLHLLTDTPYEEEQANTLAINALQEANLPDEQLG